ncbi:MAG: hypothetical protein ACKO46_06580, partial [Alphaproteobacteria bacterium]
PLFLKNYNESFTKFENQFEKFIKDTQDFSLNKNFPDLNINFLSFKKEDSIGRLIKKKIVKKINKIKKNLKN